MTVINTNVKALYTQAALRTSNRDSQVAMQQLSTGKRINSSKDDAAGLAIAARMTQNIQGLKQAVRNAGDAISMIQTAEGATQEITVMLQRMSELAVQASNSTYSDEQRGYLDQEFQQLKQEIVRISDTHEWNGFPILNGKAGMPVGAPKIETVARAGVTSAAVGKALVSGDVEIQTAKGSFPIPASLSSSDPKSSALAFSSNKAGSAIAIAAAINSQVGVTGVNATVNSAVVSANKTTVGTTAVQTDLYVNGEKVALSLSAGQTLGERRQYVMESINAGTAVHGVTAGDGGNGGLTLKTVDGRNLSVWYDSTSVQGSDFGLGLDTATASNPLGVTGILGNTGVSAGSTETANLTFTNLASGENVTVNGLTFTASEAISSTQVAAAFSNLKSGITAIAATAANPTSAAVGKFSGVFAEGFTTGVNTNGKLVATATSKGNVGDIVVGGTTKLAVTTTDGGSATAPTFSITTPGVDPTPLAAPPGAGTQEVRTVTFGALAAGQSVTVDGLTFTATAAMDATTVAGKFTNIARSTSGTATTDGTWSGTLSANWASSGGANNTVTFTAHVPALAPPAMGTLSSATADTSVITFPSLEANQSYTVGGLTFKANAAMTDTQVASAFASIADNATTGPSTTLGTYAGKLVGFRTVTASTNTVTAISTATANVKNIEVTQSKYPLVVTSNGATVDASTVYGTVTLTSNEPFTIKPGANAYAQGATPAVDPTYSNFTALGFEAKTINPKNIGRLSFQVGPAENQLITIDMADFGPNGDITGPITSDKAPTNIRTVQSSNDVIMNVNKSLDRIAETRATMGAVMNRLEHVIDNLTSVVMNSEASRSQIEDADYAQASTELARTQIMQQAATAVLAQANTSQQTVLKLLQG
jgi:flagellin